MEPNHRLHRTQFLGAHTGTDLRLAWLGFALALAAIVGAWIFQAFGYQPCELCLTQRLPYYLGLPLLALALLSWPRLAPLARLAALLIVAGLFIWGAFLGIYHSGVEWGFWPGPTACTGDGAGLSFSDLSNLNAAKVVPCDKPAIRILGLSLAGYNAIVSTLVAALLLLGARHTWTARQAPHNEMI